jgi:hypothetical protein
MTTPSVTGVTTTPKTTATTTTPAATDTAPTSGATNFADELKKQTTATAAPQKKAAPAAPKSEKTEAVKGHAYSEITAGPRNGMFLNETDNARSGQAFLIVNRGGREFHVYGTGADRAVFEVKPAAKKA